MRWCKGSTKKRNDLRENIAKIIALYQAGLTAQTISIKFSTSKRLILQLLRENNIERRVAARPKGAVAWNKGKRCPQLGGKKHWCWKGGITPLMVRIRRCARYKAWVKAVFERDNYICQLCKKRGRDLQADHCPKMFCDVIAENKIKTFEEAINCKELWNITNGRTLCKSCHRKTFKFKGNQFVLK